MSEHPPTEYPPLAPVLAVRDVSAAIGCYTRAFGGVELGRLIDPRTGRVAHAEIRLPGGPLLLLEERPRSGSEPRPEPGFEPGTDTSPGSVSPSTPGLRLCLFVADADAVTAACAAAGMRVIQPPKTHFHGHRCSLLEDPEGHQWMVSQVVEPLAIPRMQARWDRSVSEGRHR